MYRTYKLINVYKVYNLSFELQDDLAVKAECSVEHQKEYLEDLDLYD